MSSRQGGKKQIIRKIVTALLFVVTASAYAQQAHTVASYFAQWKEVPIANASGTVYTFEPSQCSTTAGPYTFNTFTQGVPVKIVDPGNPSIDEMVTPSAVTNNGNVCLVTATTVNTHLLPFYFVSGTQGAQEAINAIALTGQINVLVLDTVFHQLGGGAITAYGLAGNANVPLMDETIAPYAAYRWNGTHYVTNYTSPNGTVLPTLAAGAAAGSSPTVSNVTGSTVNILQASVGTGTATTTGTLFTETYPANAFATAANCTGQSVGTNTPPAFTVALSYTSSQAIVTVAVAAAPTASTTYLFNMSCN
jgi:hypothetical protein